MHAKGCEGGQDPQFPEEVVNESSNVEILVLGEFSSFQQIRKSPECYLRECEIFSKN